MKSAAPVPSIKLWHAPDVMDALMLKGQYVGHRYPPHSHDTHCIALVTSGALEVTIKDQRRLCVRGDAVIIDAEVVHAAAAAGGGHWKMRVAHVHPMALAEYCDRLGIARRERFELKNAFINDEDLSRNLYGINWCSENDGDPFKRSEALACAVLRLREKYSDCRGDLPLVRPEPCLIRAVKNRLREELDAKITLPLLASEFGVTPFVLLRAFLRQVGLSPHAFQQQERVRKAMDMLRRGHTIAEASLRTGFCDQSHLTRVFKQLMGATPKLYQAAFSKSTRKVSC
jgi:AraC-like DNA-binding protein